MVLWHLELICKSNVEKFEAGWMDAKEALKCKPRLMVHSGKSSEDPDANRNADSKGLVQTVPEEMKRSTQILTKIFLVFCLCSTNLG